MTKKISYERELGIMATQIKNIEITVNKIDKKLDDLPKIYATKDELKKVEKNLIERDNHQDKKNDSKWDWISKNWFQIMQFIAIIVIGMIAAKGGF
jgi:hypothetical protein